MTLKEYSKPPLPFEGNKKLWRKNYKEILKEYNDIEIFVDLFGGSGILSNWTKNTYKDAIVIYNDFDNYRERLNNIQTTNKNKRFIFIVVLINSYAYGAAQDN